MKCPYNNFEECIVEQCPSCEYKIDEYIAFDGFCPNHMSYTQAIEKGYMYEVKRKRYNFISCKLINDGVQPIPKSETHIHNKNINHIEVRTSLF